MTQSSKIPVIYNLDDDEERSQFLERCPIGDARRLAMWLNIHGPSAATIAAQLRCYAVNIDVARRLRAKGNIADALKYESTADHACRQLPASVRW